ncbi:hypothetical protein AM493_01820 [Flavobacterium akiainvivens]|uniref:Thioredoxin domain-containing protein n=1 Tax=Flavobacterium akiainvivens TaxID=1202724 RepID=A0A0M9VGW1_9FLAO|nr:TlpA disulfide reductase family protein [Flavobacterium akiainvivens]KOS04912.1 hypothetical protein AM493_01820 [Flavobacterium akiainvivens]SFQ42272.1 Peroxiredoxin [Flavobacterium akiainvivens]
MKKTIAFLALAAVSLVSCNNLKDNEYQITGEINSALEGKKAILEKAGGMFGTVPVDTVVIKNGEFVFKDSLKNTLPEIAYITIEGVENRLEFVLEPGAIDLTVDKDSLFKSKVEGTYNNDKLEEFNQIKLKVQNKFKEYGKKFKPQYEEAMKKNDQAAVDKIIKGQDVLLVDADKEYVKFMKENPKAFYNLYVIQQVAQMQKTDMKALSKIFEGFDASIKKTERGKQVAEVFKNFNQPQQPQQAPAAVKVGDAAPQFSAPTPEGKQLSLKEAMGKVTIIDFWASWCGPCRKENPNVVALYNEYHAKGLNIIGVSLDKEGESAKWKEAIAKDKLAWNHVSNLKFWEDPIAKQYGVQSIPATFILDASGKVVAKDLRGDDLKAKVAELLK